jgi:hypothetical protein
MYPNHPAVAFYLELLQSCSTGELRPESYVLLQPGKGGLLQIVKRAAVPILQSLLRLLRLELARRAQYDPSTRREGMDWPAFRGASSSFTWSNAYSCAVTPGVIRATASSCPTGNERLEVFWCSGMVRV